MLVAANLKTFDEIIRVDPHDEIDPLALEPTPAMTWFLPYVAMFLEHAPIMDEFRSAPIRMSRNGFVIS